LRCRHQLRPIHPPPHMTCMYAPPQSSRHQVRPIHRAAHGTPDHLPGPHFVGLGKLNPPTKTRKPCHTRPSIAPQTQTHTNTHKHTHTNTHTQTHTHTHRQTHTHTHTGWDSLDFNPYDPRGCHGFLDLAVPSTARSKEASLCDMSWCRRCRRERPAPVHST
jgi:hypothetical protein